MSGIDRPENDGESLPTDPKAQALAGEVRNGAERRTFATSVDLVAVGGTQVPVKEASGRYPVKVVVVPDADRVEDTGAALAGMGIKVETDLGSQATRGTRDAIQALKLPEDEDAIEAEGE